MTESSAGQTVETAQRTISGRFRTHAIESADLDARILVGAALGLDLTGVIAAASRFVTSDESIRLEDFARRRLQGEPVARILGAKEFWGLPLQLSAETLVPRPDTETVVELALEILRAGPDPDRRLRIADIGTGSPRRWVLPLRSRSLPLYARLPTEQGVTPSRRLPVSRASVVRWQATVYTRRPTSSAS